jgi:hypothetical protein
MQPLLLLLLQPVQFSLRAREGGQLAAVATAAVVHVLYACTRVLGWLLQPYSSTFWPCFFFLLFWGVGMQQLLLVLYCTLCARLECNVRHVADGGKGWHG